MTLIIIAIVTSILLFYVLTVFCVAIYFPGGYDNGDPAFATGGIGLFLFIGLILYCLYLIGILR